MAHAKAEVGKPCPQHNIEECGICHGALAREAGDKIPAWGWLIITAIVAAIGGSAWWFEWFT